MPEAIDRRNRRQDPGDPLWRGAPAGEFSRRVRFPAEIDGGGVQAVLQEGALALLMPKAPSAMPPQIDVKLPGHPG